MTDGKEMNSGALTTIQLVLVQKYLNTPYVVWIQLRYTTVYCGFVNFCTRTITLYGPFKPSSQKYESVSVNYKKIHAPTLLLQGTADPTVPWQSVQFFYDELRQTNKNAHLILVPGAGHGVHDKEGQTDINQWYKETGM
ncbi:hypothetical protein GCM10025859_42240 [Alicyclobacillus fastidiosus]|nr:hypothetical protein GCM10025859_42240 [Alicyclobacillus fastidiosus]